MVTTVFKEKVRNAILEARKNYGGTDRDFATSIGISGSIFSRLNKGEVDRIISDPQWFTIGRILDVQIKDTPWRVAKTIVYEEIEKSLKFCQEANKSMILVDACGIGKTFCAKHIIRGLKNGFYVDCSQAKTKQLFIRLLAKTVGVAHTGKFSEVKANLKYFLNVIEKPIIVLDEAGDLEYTTYLDLKEVWNATQGSCAWYMMGADGLRAKVNRGITNEKVGFAELLSRFSDDFTTITPTGASERNHFYMQLFADVANLNANDKSQVNKMVKAAMAKQATLRYLETLIKMN